MSKKIHITLRDNQVIELEKKDFDYLGDNSADKIRSIVTIFLDKKNECNSHRTNQA